MISPWLEIDSPVSVGVAVPGPNSRFNCPDGVVLSLPTGSACQREGLVHRFRRAAVEAEAVMFRGWELAPIVAVAGPAGKGQHSAEDAGPAHVQFRAGRGVADTHTGPVIEDLGIGDVGGGVELGQLVYSTACGGHWLGAGGQGCGCAITAGAGTAATLAGEAASIKADGGSPPTVSASAAFSA